MPEVRTRGEAKALGLIRYFTGKPCPRGHIAERRVTSCDCMECSREYSRRYTENHREQCKAACRASRAANPTKARAWREANHEKIRATGRNWHLANADRQRATNKAWYAANVDRKRATERARYKANADKERASSRAQYEANPDRHKAAVRAWRQANPDRARAASRAWREANSERLKAANRAWQQSNPDRVRAYNHNRRARKRSAEGSHTSQDVQNIYAAQEGLCAYCRVDVGTDYHVDHIQPLSRGGSNGKENLQITCPTCNLRKNTKTHEEFLKELKLQEHSELELELELEL